ncbi:MAG: hypothetical protein ABXS92_01865 [Sulfurimonas sp.]
MKTKLITTLLALLLSGSMLNAEVYAVVNGENLTDKEVKPMLGMIRDAKSVSDLNENEKKMILDQTVEKMLIRQQAKKEKVEERPEFQKIVNDFKNRLIVDFWMKQKHDGVQVSDKELKDYLEKNMDSYPKGATVEKFKDELTKKVQMQKFQVMIDKKLSQMKKEAKIEYK